MEEIKKSFTKLKERNKNAENAENTDVNHRINRILSTSEQAKNDLKKNAEEMRSEKNKSIEERIEAAKYVIKRGTELRNIIEELYSPTTFDPPPYSFSDTQKERKQKIEREIQIMIDNAIKAKEEIKQEQKKMEKK